MAADVYILPRERVHPVDIPFTQAIAVFSKWALGLVSSSAPCARPRPSGSYTTAPTVWIIGSNSTSIQPDLA